MKFFHVKKFTIIFQMDKGWQIAYENVEGLCCGLSYLLVALLSISQLRSIIFSLIHQLLTSNFSNTSS